MTSALQSIISHQHVTVEVGRQLIDMKRQSNDDGRGPGRDR